MTDRPRMSEYYLSLALSSNFGIEFLLRLTPYDKMVAIHDFVVDNNSRFLKKAQPDSKSVS